MRLLYIEDDQELATTIKRTLEEHFSVEIAHTGGQGWEQLQLADFDLVIIDYILPDFGGVELCRKIRKAGMALPILMLTGEQEVETKVSAFDAGADDYLTKPFSSKELFARIRALLRRPALSVARTLLVGEITLDLLNHVAIRQKHEIPLRSREFQILEYLMRNAGRTVTKQMIFDQVWHQEDNGVNVIEVNINYLRDKLDKPFRKKQIQTVRGVGYKFNP